MNELHGARHLCAAFPCPWPTLDRFPGTRDRANFPRPPPSIAVASWELSSVRLRLLRFVPAVHPDSGALALADNAADACYSNVRLWRHRRPVVPLTEVAWRRLLFFFFRFSFRFSPAHRPPPPQPEQCPTSVVHASRRPHPFLSLFRALTCLGPCALHSFLTPTEPNVLRGVSVCGLPTRRSVPTPSNLATTQPGRLSYPFLHTTTLAC